MTSSAWYATSLALFNQRFRTLLLPKDPGSTPVNMSPNSSSFSSSSRRSALNPHAKFNSWRMRPMTAFSSELVDSLTNPVTISLTKAMIPQNSPNLDRSQRSERE
uniref:Uncharacterized protein n=1 Tax=Opuntia streptacantha TaxID=393608 RepID=A0A7C9AIK4_OPUST